MEQTNPDLRRLCDRRRLTVLMPNPMKKFPPLPANHPLVLDCDVCPACRRAFQAGDVVTLRGLGPGEDPEQRHYCRRGGLFTAVAIPVHHACATGQE